MAGAATRRTERLLTLVFVLLHTRRGVTRDTLRATIADYAASTSEVAFERMFERDKESLRELGIPLVTVQLDAFHDDEWGYRIDGSQYRLPPISFTPDELVALDAASRAWRRSALEGSVADALRKLESTGIDLPDSVSALAIDTRLGAAEPAVPTLMRAINERREVTFAYRKPGAEPEPRRIAPWGIVLRLGIAYVAGFDRNRGEQRVFRVSRIEGEVSIGRLRQVDPPADFNLREAVSDGLPETVSGVARLRIPAGRAMSLRQEAGAAADDPVITLPFRSLDRLERQVAGYGPDVVVLDPPELRDAVMRRLQGVLAP